MFGISHAVVLEKAMLVQIAVRIVTNSDRV